MLVSRVFFRLSEQITTDHPTGGSCRALTAILFFFFACVTVYSSLTTKVCSD